MLQLDIGIAFLSQHNSQITSMLRARFVCWFDYFEHLSSILSNQTWWSMDSMNISALKHICIYEKPGSYMILQLTDLCAFAYQDVRILVSCYLYKTGMMCPHPRVSLNVNQAPRVVEQRRKMMVWSIWMMRWVLQDVKRSCRCHEQLNVQVRNRSRIAVVFL